MKTFFKDTDKLIVNSMDYSESLVGKQFLSNLQEEGKTLKVEQRNDVNDNFDGLVISIVNEEPTGDGDQEFALSTVDLTADVANRPGTLSINLAPNPETVPDAEMYKLVDCDIEEFQKFYNYLTSNGCSNVTFDLNTQSITADDNPGIKGSFVIPEGMFKLYKFQSNTIYKNTEFTIEFIPEQV